MNKKTIITLSAAGIILTGLTTPKPASAFWPFSSNDDQQTTQSETQTERPFQDLITKLVEKFGLNQTEVEEVFDTFHQERQQVRQQEMQTRYEDRLTQAVEDGDITEEQKQLILAKHEEMQGQIEDMSSLTPEERREAAESHHDEMETWAEENGIDLPLLNFGPMDHGGRGGGMGGPGKGW